MTYYAFCSESQAAADDAANDEDAAGQDAADDDANATGDDADESHIVSSQTGEAINHAALAGVGSIAGILAAVTSPPSHNYLFLALSFTLSVLIVKRTGFSRSVIQIYLVKCCYTA